MDRPHFVLIKANKNYNKLKQKVYVFFSVGFFFGTDTLNPSMGSYQLNLASKDIYDFDIKFLYS